MPFKCYQLGVVISFDSNIEDCQKCFENKLYKECELYKKEKVK